MKILDNLKWKWIAIGIFSAWISMTLNSCVSDEPTALSSQEITFMAKVGKEKNVPTRSVVFTPLNPLDYKDEVFYIYTETDETKLLLPYRVASGVSGQLIAEDSNDKLLWRNKTAYHTFSGWTLPWQRDTYEVGDETKTRVWFLEDKYKDMGFGRTSYLNCRLLEKFLGAKTEPLNYESNGEIVEMYYQHLVSKIHINPVKLIENDGTTVSGLTAIMTFYQLPQWAVFDRFPEDGGAPRVIQDESAEKGVTCTIASATDLYICPEVDFADMKFSIHIESSSGAATDYFGDFSSVKFDRGDDTPQPEWDKGKSPTVLYAGEEMSINLTVREGNAGGLVTVNISNWIEPGWRNGTSYPRKGIYDNSELLDFYNKFSDGNYTQEDVEEIFDIYGQEVDGKKVVYIYEDCSTTHSRIVVPKELVLDGAGHTVQIAPGHHSVNGPDGSYEAEYTAHVGNCRNIFVTDGEYTIYIDENRRVWTVNSETLALTDTGVVLPDLNDPAYKDYNSYYIDYKTGNYALSKNN